MLSPLMIGFWIFVYVYFAFCLQVIGKKTNTSNDWLAWLPIVNLFYMLQIAGKPMWWVLGLCVPLVNLVFLVLIWNAIIEKRRGAPSTAGWTMIIPVLNYLVLTRLAFHDEA